MKRENFTPHEAFVAYRVLCRINEQCVLAYQFGRDADAHSMGRLIGSLEYQIFGSASIAAFGDHWNSVPPQEDGDPGLRGLTL